MHESEQFKDSVSQIDLPKGVYATKPAVNKKIQMIILVVVIILTSIFSFLVPFFNDDFLDTSIIFFYLVTPLMIFFNILTAPVIAVMKKIPLGLKVFYFIEIVLIVSLIFSSIHDNPEMGFVDSLIWCFSILVYFVLPYLLVRYLIVKLIKKHQLFWGFILTIIFSLIFFY